MRRANIWNIQNKILLMLMITFQFSASECALIARSFINCLILFQYKIISV